MARCGWTTEGNSWTSSALEAPAQLLIQQWLTAIDEFEDKIHRLQRRIEECANDVEAVERLMTVPGIAAYSGLMIYAEIGEIDRFDRAAEVVSYAGLDPVVRASGETRTEGSISQDENGYLRWILVQCASTAVFNAKDPYLSEFYWRLRDGRNKPHKVAIVATARKLLVSLFHMLSKEEVYDPVM